MISGSSIKNILIEFIKNDPVLSVFPEIVKDVHKPVKEDNVKERIVVVLPGGVDNGQLSRSYPRICLYVPDVKFKNQDKSVYYRPDNKRLTELEDYCIELFRSGIYGKIDERVYIFNYEDILMESDPDTWSHFLNIRLKFHTVNTKL